MFPRMIKVNSRRVANLRSELENFLSGIEEVKAVVEAGCSSYTMVDVLDDMGIEVTVAHPKEVKAIFPILYPITS